MFDPQLLTSHSDFEGFNTNTNTVIKMNKITEVDEDDDLQNIASI